MSTEFRDSQIEMSHGAGGQATRRLIEGLIQPAFSNPLLDPLGDAALIEHPGGRLAFTTDSFVVRPLAFPGGSIGELAVNGTVNDLAVCGATPVALAASLILEAGLPVDELRREVQALAAAAQRAGVSIVTGDTKVVEHGKADGLYITTSGVGVVDPRAELAADRVQPGDAVLLSGPIGAHGITLLVARAELALVADLQSDTRPLCGLTQALVAALGPALRWMRDATRGGVATVLHELADAGRVGVLLRDDAIPVDDPVRGACELLGLDPLHVANEGQFVAIVAHDHAARALDTLHAAAGGARACVIGQITAHDAGYVRSETAWGGRRSVSMLVGDPLPRIC